MIEAPLYLDFYKTFHHKAYKPGVVGVYSNFTARNGTHSNIPNGSTVRVAGLQGFLCKILEEEWGKFFAAPVGHAIRAYEVIVGHGLGRPERAAHLQALHTLGYLPLRFKALKEGLEVPYGIPHFTVESTVDGFGWLTNMIESVASAEVWPVQTALTTSCAYRDKFIEYAKKTGFPEELVVYQGHDFSFRGMMGVEAAKLTGMGHLMSGFVGSDTIPATVSLFKYYIANGFIENPCSIIASVDATEHSVQCSFSDDEAYLDHCMDVASPTGILSIVSDGYDFWKLVTEFIPARKEKILSRDGKIVIRPDSGDPVEILCGIETYTLHLEMDDLEGWKEWVAAAMDTTFRANLDAEAPHLNETRCWRFGSTVYEVTYKPDLNRHDKQYYYVDNYGSEVKHCEFTVLDMTPEHMGLVEYLWSVFGGTETEKGYKLLNEHIGCIYGDSITLERQDNILRRLADKGFCSGNVVLGIGSYSYQYVTRDTHGSAIKATSISMEDGSRVDIFKDPKTGDGSKKSAKGLLFVSEVDGEIVLEDQVSREKEQSEDNMLKLVWENGDHKRLTSLKEIRETVANT